MLFPTGPKDVSKSFYSDLRIGGLLLLVPQLVPVYQLHGTSWYREYQHPPSTPPSRRAVHLSLLYTTFYTTTSLGELLNNFLIPETLKEGIV